MDSYPHFWLVLGLTTVWSLTATRLVYNWATRSKLLPKIRERDSHSVPKPRVGGVAMLLAFVVAVLVFSHSGLLNFTEVSYFGLDRAIWGILAGLGVLLFFGLRDDLGDLKAKWQLLGQVLAGLCLVAAQIGVPYVRLPFDHQLAFGPLASAIFTVLWIVVTINVFNFFDGLDGLAGSVALTSAAVLFFISLHLANTATATLALLTLAITLGFLPWNWYPSKIFMGTVGSQLLGFLLGVLAIISGGKLATVVLVLGVPVFDAFVVILRRLSKGQSPFKADATHLHHRLLRLGLPVPGVVVVVNLFAVTFGVLALRAQNSNQKGLLSLLLVLGMLGLLLLTYALERRQVRR